MIVLDGKKCAEDIFNQQLVQVAAFGKAPRLAVVVVGKDPVVEKFIERKRKAAERIGVGFHVYPFEATISANDLRTRVAEIVHEEKNTGVIIQLPLPKHIGKQHMLNAIVPSKDVDVLSSRALGRVITGTSPIISPVAAAIKTLFTEYKIEYASKRIVIMGAGALVGKPVALWFLSEGVGYSVVTERTPDGTRQLKEADIIISGIGKPKFITGDMVKEGVVVLDFGSSFVEDPATKKRKTVGDVDFDAVKEKAEAITPVPGGVGPMLITMLMASTVWSAKLAAGLV